MIFVERVNIFGDLSGINASDIRTFVNTTNYSYGGSYPNRETGLPDEEVKRRTTGLLTEVGILDPSPITPCSTPEERAARILQKCNALRIQNGADRFWIIDRDPKLLLEGFKSAGTANLETAVLRSITMVQLSSSEFSDCLDSDTGIRVVSLPSTLYRFPTHPTSAS